MSVDLPDSYNRDLLQRYRNILSRIRFPQISESLVSYVSNFGNIVHGNLKKNYYKPRVDQEIEDFFQLLKNVESTSDEYQPLWFKLHLLRCAVNEHWRWPCLITETNSRNLSWNSGQGRMCVTGLCYSEPWKYLTCLMLQNKQTPIDNYLDNPTLITSDKLLHNKLGIEYSDCDPYVTDINLSFIFRDNQLIFDGLYDGNSNHNLDAGKNLLQNFLDWKNQYGIRPKLHVYTEWPDLVKDYRNIWDIELHHIVGPEFFEIALYRYNNNPTHGKDHTLFVYSPKLIDVGLLLSWVDLTHTGFLDINRNFALVRPSDNYLTTEVRINLVDQ